MTLNECIAECERIARVAEPLKQTDVYKYNKQLAEWLRELQECREIMEFIDSNVRVIETNDGVMIRFGGGNVCEWARRKGEHL